MTEKVFAVEFKNEEERIYKAMNEKDSVIYLRDTHKFYDINLEKKISTSAVRMHYWCNMVKIIDMVKKGIIPTFKWLCSVKWWIEGYYNLVK